MQPEQQQRIMGYFIEEAKEHLNTIEQGLLNLQSTIEDPELVNELFRAAHSVKGGAAMLGLNNIQRISHRLEDFFKVLREVPIRVDQHLESLFLQVFDGLKAQLDHLQGGAGLSEEAANAAVDGIEPVFVQLEQHLNTLTGGAVTTEPIVPAAVLQSSLMRTFKTEVPTRLREMLELFKQAENEVTRQRLQSLCDSLSQCGEQFELNDWCHLLRTANQAIADSNNSFRVLAPLVIKDIKQAQDLVLTNRAAEISPCDQLIALVPLTAAAATPEADLSDLLAFDDESPLDFGSSDDVDVLGLDSLDLSEAIAADSSDGLNLFEADGDFGLEPVEPHQGPEVGIAELNSLADLFEGEMPDLGNTWQQEEVLPDETGFSDDLPLEPLNPQGQNDFSDLLFETPDHSDTSSESADDLAALFDETEDVSPAEPFAASPFERNEGVTPEDDLNDFLDLTEPAEGLSAVTDPFGGIDLDTLPDNDVNGAGGAEVADSSLGDLGDLFAGMDATELVVDQDDSLLEELADDTGLSGTNSESGSFAPESLPDLWEESAAASSLGFEVESATNDADFSDLFAANNLNSLSDEPSLDDLDLDLSFNAGSSSETDDSSFEELLASSESSDTGAIATPNLDDALTGELDALDFGDLTDSEISTGLDSSSDLDVLDFGDLIDSGESPATDLADLEGLSTESTSAPSDSIPDPWSDPAEFNVNSLSENAETGLFDDLNGDTDLGLADLDLEAETADPFGMEVADLGATVASPFEQPISDTLSDVGMFDLEADATSANPFEDGSGFDLESASETNPVDLSLDELGLDSLAEDSDQLGEVSTDPEFDAALLGETAEDELGFFSMEGDLDDSSMMAIDSDAESTFSIPDATTDLLGFDDADSKEVSGFDPVSGADDGFGDLLLDADAADLSELDLSAELDLSMPTSESVESLNFDDLESESLFAESATSEDDLLSFDDGAIANDNSAELGDDLLSMDLGSTENDNLLLDLDQFGAGPAESTDLLFEETTVISAADPFALPEISSESASTSDMELGLDFDGLEAASGEGDLDLGLDDLAAEPTLDEGDLGLDFDGLTSEPTAEFSSDTADLGLDFDSLGTESSAAAASDMDLGLDFDGLETGLTTEDTGLSLDFDSLETEPTTDATDLGLDFGDLASEPTGASSSIQH